MYLLHAPYDLAAWKLLPLPGTKAVSFKEEGVAGGYKSEK